MTIKPDPAFMDARAADFLRRIQISTNWGRIPPTLEHLIGPFYVLHKRGGGYQSGRDWLYGRAEHTLLDLRLDDGDNQYRTYTKCRVNGDYQKEGRFTKADRAAWLRDATELASR